MARFNSIGLCLEHFHNISKPLIHPFVDLVVVQAHFWLRELPKLEKLQHDIQTVKCSFNIVIGRF